MQTPAVLSDGLDGNALRSFRLFESDDLADACDRMASVLRPHTVRAARTASHPSRRIHMDLVRFAGMSLSAIDYGREVVVSAASRSEYYSIILCTRGHAVIAVDGDAMGLHAAQALLTHPGEHIEARFSADCEQLHVRIEARSLAVHTGLKSVRFKNGIDLRQARLQPWIAQLKSIARSAPLLDLLCRHPIAAASMERLFLDLLLAGQPWNDARAQTRSIAPGCVKRAEAFIEEKAGELIRLDDIARAAGVPARTLHHSFRRFRDSTPIQYLGEVRLERARRLLESRQGDATVTTVALDCGFPHLGRFATAYRDRFGESPSQTCRKTRQDG